MWLSATEAYHSVSKNKFKSVQYALPRLSCNSLEVRTIKAENEAEKQTKQHKGVGVSSYGNPICHDVTLEKGEASSDPASYRQSKQGLATEGSPPIPAVILSNMLTYRRTFLPQYLTCVVSDVPLLDIHRAVQIKVTPSVGSTGRCEIRRSALARNYLYLTDTDVGVDAVLQGLHAAKPAKYNH
ncbi:hypothetical protein J6590_019938 [Homalodisca vitripennis]|nr:hypothetical protein J6590_091598 [Homalodisca vitripennis]KAG8337537.1 hypothetical protein J6590_019938 [Homalodisca vitripennis]